jgi:hypothetical protein
LTLLFIRGTLFRLCSFLFIKVYLDCPLLSVYWVENYKAPCFYMISMELVTKYVIAAAVPAVLLLLAASNHVYAWGGGCGWGGCYHGCGYGCDGIYSNAYYAGEQDAIYDHDNGQSYNPIGQCLPCHSDFYWQNFHQGYDHQWQTYQSQESNQGSSINIYGNNNYVSTNQYSNQQQNPLQQLSHVVCGFVNCNQPDQP